MADEQLDRLREALADRYELQRELGHGGMATVYLATDRKLGRPVALKVLKPELAHALGPERFLREIEISARLRQPHILPLHDSGEADGFLYYTMPFVEGGTLRDRLDREKQLSIDDALRVTSEIADALGYAHALGIVHRDIKPENVLFQAGHAVVSDFGIARAIAAAGQQTLTETGLAVGTPAYMSPEQATGEKDLDGRSDLYSLGCLLFEMLSGEPPYGGAMPQAILARKLSDPVPSVSVVRDTVPHSVASALTRVLSKVPADRYSTARQFVDALHREPSGAFAPSPPSIGRRRAFVGVIGTVVLTIAVSAVFIVNRWRATEEQAAGPDPNTIAVLPFRVASARPELDTLASAILDAFWMKVTGEFGPRASDPSTVLRALQRAGEDSSQLTEDAQVAVAAALGAGKLVRGLVSETDTGIVLSATMLDVPDGTIRVRPTTVEGRYERRFELVDRLVSQLLAQDFGEAAERAMQLSVYRPDVVQAYLTGRQAYRRGDYDVAFLQFDAALQEDSTFVEAALGMDRAGFWAGGIATPSTRSRARRLAWEQRDRLSRRDSTLLVAQVGRRYPAPTPYSEQVETWRLAAELAPDDPDAWVGLGEVLFHHGQKLEEADPIEAALFAFGRAVALDSNLAAATDHLSNHATFTRDREALRALPPMADRDIALAIIRADALSDTVTLDSLRAILAPAPNRSLLSFVNGAWGHGLALDEADSAVALVNSRVLTPSEARSGLATLHRYSLARGRPREARRYLRRFLAQVIADEASRATAEHRALLWDGLYGGGDSAAAAQAADELQPLVALPDSGTLRDRDQGEGLCALEQWRIAHGETARAGRVINALRSTGPPVADDFFAMRWSLCAHVLAGMLAVAELWPNRTEVVASLDSLLLTGPPDAELRIGGATLALARLWESEGEFERALAAVRRRWYSVPPVGGMFLPAMLRLEARLAAVAGDTAAALWAYDRYLTLLSDPEPERVEHRERVRAELADLIGERG